MHFFGLTIYRRSVPSKGRKVKRGQMRGYRLSSGHSEAGLPSPVITALEIETQFPDFEAFWRPFTLGAGPAPGYCMNLPEDQRSRLKARLADRLGTTVPIRLVGRAWAVKAALS
jgi:hypothetical protein